MLFLCVRAIIIEKIIAPKVGKYKREEELAKTEQYNSLTIVEEEQKRIEQEKNEKKGLRTALIITIVYLLFVIYALIPTDGSVNPRAVIKYLIQPPTCSEVFFDIIPFIKNLLPNATPIIESSSTIGT